MTQTANPAARQAFWIRPARVLPLLLLLLAALAATSGIGQRLT